MLRLKALFLAALLALAPSAHAQWRCPDALAAAAHWLRPSIRAWNPALFAVSLAAARAGVLTLEQVDQPEKLLAYADSLNPREGFAEQLQAIEALGGRVKLRDYRFPLRLAFHQGQWEWEVRAPEMSVRRDWRRYGVLPYLSREGRAILTTANAPPESPQQFYDWIKKYAAQFTHYRTLLAAGRSPWFPAPWRPAPFPQRALDHLEASESFLYGTLEALENHYPTVVASLPPTDGIWKWRRLQIAVGLPVRLIFPSYNALAPYRPNQEHREAWENGQLRPLIEKKYHARLQWKWLVDRYRGTVLGTLLTSVSLGAYHTYDDVISGEFQQKWASMVRDIEELPGRFSRTQVNQGLERYESNVEGDPDVVEYYDSQIRVLEKSIQESGDLDGDKRKQIKQLIESRDLLKN